MDIVEVVKNIKNSFKSEGVTPEQINDAENDLKLDFSEEFKKYLKNFGAISFGSTEISGLNVDKYLNVVELTKKERSFSHNFPMDCIVIENLGNEGLIIIQNNKSEIFEFFNGKAKKIHNSLAEYIYEVSRDL